MTSRTGFHKKAWAVDYAADQWSQVAQASGDVGDKACADRFAGQAAAIRALLDTKEVRDDG